MYIKDLLLSESYPELTTQKKLWYNHTVEKKSDKQQLYYIIPVIITIQ